jgi:hypothetical protein
MTIRILYLAKYRIPHACFSLQWDYMLQGIDRTIVVSPVPQEEIWPVLQKYRIDVSNFDYVNDQDILTQYPEVEHWVLPNDYRGYWLRQQALKLSSLDYLDYDIALMHDPDTFMIEPYRCHNNNVLNYLALENTTHGSYEGMFRGITGHDRQTPHCFVTELVPVKKTHITAMREFLEHKHGENWLDAMINHCPGMATIPPWGNGEIIKWFSEYEFIGNWAMMQEQVNFSFQRRFEYDQLNKLSQLDPAKFNAVCDAVPDLSMSLQMDWEKQQVIDFDHYVNIVKSILSGLPSS